METQDQLMEEETLKPIVKEEIVIPKAKEFPTFEDLPKEEKEAKLLAYAKLAELSERFDDMCKFLAALVTSKKGKLEASERNLLSVAFKNVVGSLRSAQRVMKSESQLGQDENLETAMLEGYNALIVDELLTKCSTVLEILEDQILPPAAADVDELDKLLNDQKQLPQDSADTAEKYVFFQKMKGDYHRYVAEVTGKEADGKAAETAYNLATKKAKAYLKETHPTRLGLALNFSVCYYEILKQRKKACEIAKEAFDNAIQKLDTLNDSNYKDSTLIMQLLRDNLTLWNSDDTQAAEQED